MDILIDTNFILTCAKQRIDLFSQIKNLFGNERIIVPQQVLDELKNLSSKKALTVKERESAKLAIDMINSNLTFIIDLKTKNVDQGIINYSNKNNIYLASLDKILKNNIKNSKIKFLTIREKKRIIEQN